MVIKTICNIGDIIYTYDFENDLDDEQIIDNIVITRNGDNQISDKDIILRADAYDSVICTYDKLINTRPDEGGIYYFRCKKSRRLFKETMKERNCNG